MLIKLLFIIKLFVEGFKRLGCRRRLILTTEINKYIYCFPADASL